MAAPPLGRSWRGQERPSAQQNTGAKVRRHLRDRIAIVSTTMLLHGRLPPHPGRGRHRGDRARHQIAVAGPDRATYLQGLLTNDIPALTPGTGCYSAWLTPQGRMLTDMHVLESGGMILLDVPAETPEATRRAARAVHLHRGRSGGLAGREPGGVWIHGPKAPPFSKRVDAGATRLADGRGDYHHTQRSSADQPVSVARIDQLGVPGFCVYVEPRANSIDRSRTDDAGARRVRHRRSKRRASKPGIRCSAST